MLRDDSPSLVCHESVFASVVYRQEVSEQQSSRPGSAARSSFDVNLEAWVVRGDVRRVVTQYGPRRNVPGQLTFVTNALSEILHRDVMIQ